MKKLLAWLPILLVLTVAPVFAEKSQTPPESSTSFEKLKSLQGNWAATVDMDKDGNKENIRLVYRTTSGGSALVETLSAGSPHEMVSVYHLDNGKVLMTHYCMLNNQPRMQETQASKHQLKLEKRDVTNLKTPNDPHMGGLTVTFKDKDHFNQAWVYYKPDGTQETSLFEWTREK